MSADPADRAQTEILLKLFQAENGVAFLNIVQRDGARGIRLEEDGALRITVRARTALDVEVEAGEESSD